MGHPGLPQDAALDNLVLEDCEMGNLGVPRDAGLEIGSLGGPPGLPQDAALDNSVLEDCEMGNQGLPQDVGSDYLLRPECYVQGRKLRPEDAGFRYWLGQEGHSLLGQQEMPEDARLLIGSFGGRKGQGDRGQQEQQRSLLSPYLSQKRNKCRLFGPDDLQIIG